MKYLPHISGLLLAGLPLLILQACNSSHANNEAKAAVAQAGPASIAAIRLQEESLSTSIKIPGELAAYQHVDLFAKVNSFVAKLYVDVGSEVKAGQLLATLEAPEINSQLSAAASRLKMQEAIHTGSMATYNRLLETSKTPGTISPNDLELALARQQSDEASLNAARAQYNEVVSNRNYLQVRAPFSGVISSRNVSAGAYVGPSGRGSEFPIFTLVEQKKLRLVVSVPEAYSGYLGNNSKVTFTFRSLPTDTFTATITRLAGALDNRLRAERIEMDVDNTEKKLLPGMVAEVRIPLLRGQRSLVVPSSAILNSTEGVFVIRIQNNKTIWVPVSATRAFEGKTEISGNLSVNDTLVKFASEEVRNGAAVEAIKMD
jgi:RND family efflux transporter MFP subunit